MTSNLVNVYFEKVERWIARFERTSDGHAMDFGKMVGLIRSRRRGRWLNIWSYARYQNFSVMDVSKYCSKQSITVFLSFADTKCQGFFLAYQANDEHAVWMLLWMECIAGFAYEHILPRFHAVLVLACCRYSRSPPANPQERP